MLYSRLSGSSEELLLREIPRLCSEKYKAGFLMDLTGLTAFIVDIPMLRFFSGHSILPQICAGSLLSVCLYSNRTGFVIRHKELSGLVDETTSLCEPGHQHWTNLQHVSTSSFILCILYPLKSICASARAEQTHNITSHVYIGGTH